MTDERMALLDLVEQSADADLVREMPRRRLQRLRPRRALSLQGAVNKAVVVGDDYPALVRARRRRERWSDEDRRLYQRHR